MLEFITDNDILLLFAMMTAVTALAVIIVELINFIPDLMLSVLNRMRNKTLAHEADSLTAMDYRTSLDPGLETELDKKKTLSESDLFKRFNSQ